MCWSAAHLYESWVHRQERECSVRTANALLATEAASGTRPAYSHIPMPRKMLKKSFTLQIPVGICPAGNTCWYFACWYQPYPTPSNWFAHLFPQWAILSLGSQAMSKYHAAIKRHLFEIVNRKILISTLSVM